MAGLDVWGYWLNSLHTTKENHVECLCICFEEQTLCFLQFWIPRIEAYSWHMLSAQYLSVIQVIPSFILLLILTHSPQKSSDGLGNIQIKIQEMLSYPQSSSLNPPQWLGGLGIWFKQHSRYDTFCAPGHVQGAWLTRWSGFAVGID